MSPEAADSRILNRELSWLDFNERVLSLMSEPGIPLLERVKFCAIFSSNLDEFFPSDGVGVDRARKICATCPVTAQCLEYALANHIDHGVWGGCSERERRRIAKRRRLEVQAL